MHTRVQGPVDTCGAVGSSGERRGAAAGGRGETFLTALVILSGSKSVPGMFLIPGSIPAPAAPGPPPRPPLHPTPGLPAHSPAPQQLRGPVGGLSISGASAPLRDTQSAPMGAQALAGAPQPGGGGIICSPRRGPGLAPTRDPAAADAVFPTRARDTRQRVAHPASGTAAPAPSLARSQRRVQPQGFQGAVGLELRDVPHTPRELGAALGVLWDAGRHTRHSHRAQPWGSHACLQAGERGQAGCVCGCARAGRARIDVQPQACLRRGVPSTAGPRRGRRRGRARGPRVCREPWEPRQMWVFPGAPSAARAGQRDKGGHPVQLPPPRGRGCVDIPAR